MPTLPDDPLDGEFFRHLLDYQQTDEFKRSLKLPKKERASRAVMAQRESARKYRAAHPEFARMRHQAMQHKEALYELQGGQCRWCGELLGDSYEVDRIKPLIKGGTNDLENLCVCHPRCNRKKAARDRP